ncbi:hypothetical protein [Nocardia sp. NBC_00403]|uniref:hypothetical protein n=1 Tax=Nocardia sp. NBC_00403 TaxID=2975990 RepID=UPI002E208AE3
MNIKFREACVRCALLHPDPDQRRRLIDIRDNLIARIAEAEREGWLGEVERLRVSLAGAEDRLAQIDRRSHREKSSVLACLSPGAEIAEPRNHTYSSPAVTLP